MSLTFNTQGMWRFVSSPIIAIGPDEKRRLFVRLGAPDNDYYRLPPGEEQDFILRLTLFIRDEKRHGKRLSTEEEQIVKQNLEKLQKFADTLDNKTVCVIL